MLNVRVSVSPGCRIVIPAFSSKTSPSSHAVVWPVQGSSATKGALLAADQTPKYLKSGKSTRIPCLLFEPNKVNLPPGTSVKTKAS